MAIVNIKNNRNSEIVATDKCCNTHDFPGVNPVSLFQTGPIPLQYLVKPTRKRRRPSQSAAQGHSDGINTSPASESDSHSDKVHSPAAAPPGRAPSQSNPASQDLSPAIQSSNGTAVPNNTQRHTPTSKLGSGHRKVTVNGTSSAASKEEARASEKSGAPPKT